MSQVKALEQRFAELQQDLAQKDQRVAELGSELDATMREVRRRAARRLIMEHNWYIIVYIHYIIYALYLYTLYVFIRVIKDV